MKHSFLFPSGYDDIKSSLLLVFLRISFGVMFMTHGMEKWSHFETLRESFPDPLHVGSTISLSLAIFAEVFCSMGFITGCLYRLAMIPMLFTTFIIVFVIHFGQSFAHRELATLYLCVFIVCYITGPGRFSIDRILGERMQNKH